MKSFLNLKINFLCSLKDISSKGWHIILIVFSIAIVAFCQNWSPFIFFDDILLVFSLFLKKRQNKIKQCSHVLAFRLYVLKSIQSWNKIKSTFYVADKWPSTFIKMVGSGGSNQDIVPESVQVRCYSDLITSFCIIFNSVLLCLLSLMSVSSLL